MSAPLLHISGLKKSFVAPEAVRQLIVDVPDFSLAAKTQVVLAGESGSGKTAFRNGAQMCCTLASSD
jgi:ABC-type glutathione transport system ATPase component